MKSFLPHSAFRVPRSIMTVFTVLAVACLLTVPLGVMAKSPPIKSAAEIEYPLSPSSMPMDGPMGFPWN